MKKTILLLAFTTSSLIFSQSENPSSERKNDIIVNPISLVLGVGNISYERIINENSGVGIISTFVIDNYVIENNAYQFAPYYNYYFGKKTASGFFIGGYASISGYKDKIYEYKIVGLEYIEESKMMNYSKIGLGFKFGGKWVLKNNLIFEASTGIGRNFVTKEDETKVNTTGMLGIGYRF